MRKPVLLWVDLTISARDAELPDLFLEACEINICASVSELPEIVASGHLDALCFDMDYPDRRGLDLLRRTKAEFPSVPILFLTLQHSESLAVWAFRNRVFDYLVKPVSRHDLRRTLETLLSIAQRSPRQGRREALNVRAPIPAEVPHKTRLGEMDLAPALYYVKQKFREKVLGSEVAKACGMDPFRFSRAFHAVFGLTFRDYVLRYRILEACRLLRDPNGCITDVAFAVGFNDASYFAKVFRRVVGTSPSAYSTRGEHEHADSQVSSMRSTLKLPAASWPD